MFDRIEKKVDEIRQKPEHIRKRYVWIWVAITMFIVIFIWVISLQITFFNMDDSIDDTTGDAIGDFQKSLNNLNTTPPQADDTVSIDDLLEQTKETMPLTESKL